jgi:tetratricopeptide (TPR) repeat protein
LRQALAFDPSYAPAAGLFAWCRVLQRVNRVLSDEEVAEAARLARQAIEAGKEDPDALWMGGWGMINWTGERAAGLNAIERALALNPNSALAWNFCGWARASFNQPASAIEALQRAMRLSPLDPQRWMFYGGLAAAHLVAGRHEEAVEWADRALHEQPRAIAVVAFKTAACGHLGRTEEGRECVRRYLERAPGNTIADEKRFPGTILSPEAFAVYVAGLRKAGLPEG